MRVVLALLVVASPALAGPAHLVRDTNPTPVLGSSSLAGAAGSSDGVFLLTSRTGWLAPRSLEPRRSMR